MAVNSRELEETVLPIKCLAYGPDGPCLPRLNGQCTGDERMCPLKAPPDLKTLVDPPRSFLARIMNFSPVNRILGIW